VTDAARQPIYVFDGFHLDAQRRVLRGADGQPIPLTPRLFDTLLYFVERAGQLLTKEQLMQALWPRVVVEEHNLNKTVSELRRVLGEKPGEHKFIVTKPGHGYRFVADVSVADPTMAEDATRLHQSGRPPLHEPKAEPNSEPTATIAATATPARNAHGYRVAWWGAGAIAAAVVLFGFLGQSPEAPLSVTPWSVKKGRQWFPAWSPDSRSTAFVTFGGASNEPPELVIRDLTEAIARRVARQPPNDPGGVTQWTTTGKILFFDGRGLSSISPVGGQPELVVPLDYQRLGLGNLWLRMAHVTTDGSTLAMFARDGDSSVGVWTAMPPSARLQRYDPAPFEGATFLGGPYLRFSPSGRQLLLTFYAAGRGPEAWLLPFPADARNPPRRVFEHVPLLGDNMEFSWFPDERHIVLAARIGDPGPNAKRRLYVADTESGNFRLLTERFNNPELPAVSPDGSKLIVHDAQGDFDIVTLDLGAATLTAPTIATQSMEILPAWAADVNAMVYASNRNGAWEIWLHREPEEDRPLVTASDFSTSTLLLFAPTLSPDGERVIFHRVTREGDESRLWISAVARVQPEPLTNEELTERAGSWSPDGNWYVYWSSPREGGTRTLKKVKTTGRAAPETLLEDLQPYGSAPAPPPIWSPDGEWILAAHQGLSLVAADGRTSRNIGAEAMPCAFAPAEPLLHCIRGSPGPIQVGEYALVTLDFDGKPVAERPLPPQWRPASQLTPGIRLSPTPDRLGVTYSIAASSGTLWLVEGLDRIQLP